MANFDFVSMVIGLLLGAIITLLLIWVAYYTRTFLFTYCATQSRPCGGGDYYNDPGDGLANNPNVSVPEILFINENDQMFYKRIRKNTDCVAESNQTVYMKYPQYCEFSTTAGATGVWKETAFGSNMYSPEGEDTPDAPTVSTDGDCQPSPGTVVTTGKPLLRWDANPIS